MKCPNCNTDIADHLNVCWSCSSSLITLENFLNKKSKILVIIGVFGALSIYMAQTAAYNNNNFLLELGSGVSLLVMEILVFLIIKDCYSFIKKYPEDTSSQGRGYSKWIKQTSELLYLWAFLALLSVIAVSLLIYMLLFSNIKEIFLKLLIGFILVFIFVPFIILPSIEIIRRKILWQQLVILLSLFSLLLACLLSLLINEPINFSSVFFSTVFGVMGTTLLGLILALYVIFKK